MNRAVTRGAAAGLAGLAALVTVLLTAVPALADNGSEQGEDPGKSLGTGAALLLYVLLPLAIVAVIATIVWLPGAMRTNRYRPNKAWTATPVWFAGPPEPVAAVQSATVGDVVRGGASGSW